MEIVYHKAPCTGLEILSCTGGHHFGKHLHDGYVLWLNSESAEHYNLRGSDNLLLPGTIGIIEPGEIHANSPYEGAKRHLRSFYFTQEFLENTFEQMGYGQKSQSLLVTQEIAEIGLWRNFVKLHEQLLHSRDSMALNIAVLDVFASLISLQQGQQAGEAETAMCDDRIRLVTEYIHDNYGNKISLDHLAEIANCTSYHLIRLFRTRKNVSPHTYLIQVRLEKAKSLLDSGTNIADAAFQTGFADQSHLTRNFTKRYGLPPAAYKRQHCS